MFAYNDDASADDFGSALEVSAEHFGAFEVVAGTYGIHHLGQKSSGDLVLKFTCLEACEQPQVPLEALLQGVDQASLEALLSQAVPALFVDADLTQTVLAQVDALLDGTAEGPFPVLPMAALTAGQALFEAPDHAVDPPAPVTFVLEELLTRGCTPERPGLAPAHPSLPPELTRGWPADWSFDDCTLQRAIDFAEVLNNLALDNGSKVVAGATTYSSVEDVFVALIDSGHHVVVQNNRYLANFLGLNYNGASVIAPVWLDTGIPTADGTLKIPAPHSHHTVIVEGPLVNATLMYYMGTSGGVSFRVQDQSLRPAWAGERTLYTYDSAVEPDVVVQLMTTAARLRRVWTERGQGLPVGGYGQLGVCNDSTAVLEYAAEQSITLFPLAHPPVEGTPADSIDAILAALPSDIAGFEADDAIRRALLSIPDVADQVPHLAAQLQAAAAASR
ncbi:MAG: hypothetical protein R3F60_21495 [bacterium]